MIYLFIHSFGYAFIHSFTYQILRFCQNFTHYRYIRIPNGAYAGRIALIKSLRSTGHYTLYIIKVPGGTTNNKDQTSLTKKYVDLHRQDSLNLGVEEKKAIEYLEKDAKEKMERTSMVTYIKYISSLFSKSSYILWLNRTIIFIWSIALRKWK